MPYGKPGFNEIEAYWYQVLKEEGFQDIEETTLPSRPLKDWHMLSHTAPAREILKRIREEYQLKAEEFLHGKQFKEICLLLVKRRNNTLKVAQIGFIFELHLRGYSERAIAGEMKKSKTCIHGVLERLRAWMNLA